MSSSLLLSYLPDLTLTGKLRDALDNTELETVTFTEDGTEEGEYVGITALTNKVCSIAVYSSSVKIADSFVRIGVDGSVYRIGLLSTFVSTLDSVTVSDKTGFQISGTITTLDALDTAQDTQHSTTQSALTTIDNNVDLIVTGVDAIGGIVTTISSNVSTLLSRITASVYQTFVDLGVMLTGSNTADVQFTEKALENAPTAGGSSTDWTADEKTAIKNILGVPVSGTTPTTPTVGMLDTIYDAILQVGNDQLSAIQISPGIISGFPEELIKGDSYDIDTGRIKITITDDNGDPLSGLGSLDFADADVLFYFFRPNDTTSLAGSCEFVDSGLETYVLLTLTSEVTSLVKADYTYVGRLQFIWAISSSETSERRKTYKTTPFKFISNP